MPHFSEKKPKYFLKVSVVGAKAPDDAVFTVVR
jgi:hypothetical protein